MLRSYRHLIAAAGIVCLSLAAPLAAQNLSTPLASNTKIDRSAERGTNSQYKHSAQSGSDGHVANRENAVKPECGSPKECRSEQREQDNLVAQQVIAKAAASQRNAAWWQAGVGAAGVILLILTVIYTHLATAAAINSVRAVTVVEGARLVILEEGPLCNAINGKATFNMILTNVGKTTAGIKELCMQGSRSGLYKDFSPRNVVRKNSSLGAEQTAEFLKIDFDLGDEDHQFVVGYYKFLTIFSKKLITDYFCFEVRQTFAPTGSEQYTGNVPILYRIDLDWPPDESW